MKKAILALAVVSILAGQSSADLVFDDFNTNEGHFGYAPNFSGSTVGESASSTADLVTTDGPREGTGHQKIVLVHDGSSTNMRIRHVSGGPPYTSTQAGNPAFNLTFNTTSGTDGWIGFYLKQSPANTGWTVGLNLDDSSNTGGGMDMGTPKPIMADGQWHLYEWNLDDNSQWDAVTGIGGNGTIENGQHSIDSIYIFTNTTGTAGQARAPLYLDFVALNSDGSVALITPAAVPEAGSFAAVGFVGAISAGAVWLRKKRAGRVVA